MATAPSPVYYSPQYAYLSVVAYPPPASGVFTAPPSFPSPIPTQFDPNQPPPAATPIHGDLNSYSSPFFYSAPPGFPYPPPASAYTPASGFSPNWSTWPPPAPDPTPSTFPHTPYHLPGQAAPQTDALFPLPTSAQPGVASSPRPELEPMGFFLSQPPHTPATGQCLQCELLNIEARLDQQQAHEQTSIDTIQGELVQLRLMASQLAVTMGMQTTEAPATDSSLEAVSAPLSSSAPSLSSSTATAYVAPQTLGEMPESYGFNNLVSQSIFLADGTERKYFTLPADYPLELATPQPMSNSALEKIGVTAMPSVAAQAADLAPVLCSNANNTTGSELPVPNLQQRLNVQDVSFVFTETPVYDIYEEEDSSCLNIISDVRDFSLELLQQNVERACNCPVLKASDSLVTGSSQLSVDHSTSESRLLWDPGDTKLSVLFTTAAGATKLQCIDVYNHKMVHVLPVKFGSTPYQQSYAEEQQDSEQLPMCFSKALETNQTSACWYYITDELDYALEQQQHDEKASGNVQQPRAPALNVLVLPERRKEWDPGDNCFGQRVELKQFWARLLLQSHSWYNTLTAFLQVHYCCLPIVLDCPYSEIVQQLVCYSRMFSLTEAIFSAMCKSTGTAVHMIVVLSSGKIAQEGRDAAVVYHIFEIQLPITKTSLIWDPGIESLLFSCKRLNIPALIQIKGWTSMTCSGISSSEYPYTMVFLHHQWEFLHQQVIQKKYNANNLLSSHYYLQL